MNKTLVEIAKQSLKVRETKVNNIAPEIQAMQKATWLKPGGWPWCAAFMCDTLKKALEVPEFVEYLHSRYTISGTLENWRCKDASAFGWIKWAEKLKLSAKHKDPIVFDEKYPARKGDFIVFDFSHIGLVTEDQLTPIISTIEGNTQPKTTQRDGSGDGVYEMKRSETLVKSFIRL